MIWADRLALVWGMIYAILCVWASIPQDFAIAVGLYIVGGPWIALRIIDLIFTGRIRLGPSRAPTHFPRQPPYIDVTPPHPARRQAPLDTW